MISLILILVCFLFQVLPPPPPPFILFRNGMCKEVCVCVCVVLIAINSHACCIWIVNDITDSNICLFSVSVFFLLFYFLE